MRNSRKWLTAITVLGSLMFVGSPVIAAQAGPVVASQAPTSPHLVQMHQTAISVSAAPTTDPATYNICLTYQNNLLCIESNGTGNQVTVTSNSNDYALFHTVQGANGDVKEVENALGNCLRAGTDYVVKIEDGGCASSDNADKWIVSGTSWSSEYDENPMLTEGHTSGLNVWHRPTHSGWYAAWTMIG